MTKNPECESVRDFFDATLSAGEFCPHTGVL